MTHHYQHPQYRQLIRDYDNAIDDDSEHATAATAYRVELIRTCFDALATLDGAESSNAHACIVDFWHTDADHLLRLAWLLRAMEHEYGIYDPRTRELGRYMADSIHPCHLHWNATYNNEATA